MQEHPIPQDITGYKFHIVGNMTLKQFAEAAIGVVIAFFIYKTNLVDFVKWPLVGISTAIGFALAFLPVQERPLDHWFITFFTILYKPTKFFWKKEPKIPEAFLFKPNSLTQQQSEITDLTPQRRQRISDFIQSVKTPTVLSEEDLINKQKSTQLLSIFEDKTLVIDFSKTKNLTKKPNLKVRTRSLVSNEVETEPNQTETVVYTSAQVGLNNPPSQSRSEELMKTNDFLSKKSLNTSQVATSIKIPELKKIAVEKINLENANIANGSQPKQENIVFSTTTAKKRDQQTTSAIQNKDLPFPSVPTQPNKLVGMILDQSNNLIDNATITISDENGSPITAVKTNALGQFFLSSKLNNGSYILNIKRDNFTFRPISVFLDGNIISPLEIRSD